MSKTPSIADLCYALFLRMEYIGFNERVTLFMLLRAQGYQEELIMFLVDSNKTTSGYFRHEFARIGRMKNNAEKLLIEISKLNTHADENHRKEIKFFSQPIDRLTGQQPAMRCMKRSRYQSKS